MARRSVARAESLTEIEARQSALTSAGISSAWSRYGLRRRHRSGLMRGMGPGRGRRPAVDRVVQVEAALLPAALNGPFGHPAHRGNLGEREPAEELQVDDLRQIRFDFGELVERIADQNQRAGVDDAIRVIEAERGDLEQPAALLG